MPIEERVGEKAYYHSDQINAQEPVPPENDLTMIKETPHPKDIIGEHIFINTVKMKLFK